jgi:hypothetical protein
MRTITMFVLAAFLFAASARAQVLSGSIVGQVADASDAAVPRRR